MLNLGYCRIPNPTIFPFIYPALFINNHLRYLGLGLETVSVKITWNMKDVTGRV